MTSSKLIWDVPTRLIHWAIATAVLVNLFAVDGNEKVHHRVGYVALCFVVARFIWGIVGGKHSRFSQFPLRPREVLQFAKNPLSKTLPDYPGHNPGASIVYISLWFCVIALGVTGWMLGLDAYFGDDWLEDLHKKIAIGVEVLLALHMLGLVIDSIKFKRKTWMGMILGKR